MNTILKKIIPSQVNPIVVKELRQAVRSRFVAGVFLLFLLVELLGVGIGLANSINHNYTINYYTGRSIFHFLYIALSTACILFIPSYAAIRLAMERWDSNLDLMYISTIKPAAIIRGKLFATLAIALLLFSAAAPFMSFSYLLRGVDLPSIFIALAFIFIYVALLTQFMIFVACLPTSRAFKIVLGLVALSGLFQALVFVNIAGWAIIYEGFGSKIKDPDFLITAAISLACGILGIGLIQRISVALISPPTANRSLPVRRYATITWAITGIIVIACAGYYSDVDIIAAWLIPSVIFFALAIVWGLGEKTQLSLRVRHTIPKNPIKRRIAFLFYNGPAGALFWASTLTITTFIVAGISTTFIDGYIDGDQAEFGVIIANIFLYSVAYGLAGVSVWRLLLSKRISSSAIGLIACLLAVIGSILPNIVAIITNSGSYWHSAWYIGNIFTVANQKHLYTHITFAFFFAIVMLACNGSWITNQMKNFIAPDNTQQDPDTNNTTSPHTDQTDAQ